MAGADTGANKKSVYDATGQVKDEWMRAAQERYPEVFQKNSAAYIFDEQINEMCKIVVTPTKTGVQHFDIPDLPSSQQGHLKSYQRKDRYSALLLSAHAARKYLEEGQKTIVPNIGGWVEYL